MIFYYSGFRVQIFTCFFFSKSSEMLPKCFVNFPIKSNYFYLPGIPKNEMKKPGSATSAYDDPDEPKAIKKKKSRRSAAKKEPPTVTPSVATAKTTMAHTATVEARDKVYQVM